jgi:hypothetical protein
MRTRRRATIEDLRLAIDCLPRHTRVAMLEGIAANEIIAGAYATRDGVCPMLAAHRAGGRTNLISFAKAWDRFAFRDARSQRARRATERELLILKAHLEASLLAEEAPVSWPAAAGSELAAARSEHLELKARREREREDAAERERAGEREQAAQRDPYRAEPGPRAEAEPHQRPGDPDRGPALQQRPGWAWTRVVRRYDEYERVLARLDAERAALPGPKEREPALSR